MPDIEAIPMNDSTPRRTDSHVGRVFGLLDLLGAELDELTLSELARRAKLPACRDAEVVVRMSWRTPPALRQ
jgi:IclR helix-turn-helix domain